MRMRRSLKKKYFHKQWITGKRDNEGNALESYGEATEIEATIWSASGRLQAEMYGERLAYIKNMEYDGNLAMREGDGICVFVGPEEEPDYKIISIKPEYHPIRMEVEKIVGRNTIRRY